MLDSKKLKPAKRKKIEIELKVRILNLLDANGPTMNLFCWEFLILCCFIKRSHANRVKEKFRNVHGKNGHISKKNLWKSLGFWKVWLDCSFLSNQPYFFNIETWLNHFVANCHFWCNTKRLGKKKTMQCGI